VAVDKEPLVGLPSESRDVEIELKSGIALVQLPSAPRIEEVAREQRTEFGLPLDSDINIGDSCLGPKRF
jgi:hypothetical protein